MEERKKKRVLDRQAERQKRQHELNELLARQKQAAQLDPVDEQVQTLAKNTIGLFVFKRDQQFVETVKEQADVRTKYTEFIDVLNKIFELKSSFNNELKKQL